MHALSSRNYHQHPFSSPILELLCSLPIHAPFSRNHHQWPYSSPILELLCFSSYALSSRNHHQWPFSSPILELLCVLFLYVHALSSRNHHQWPYSSPMAIFITNFRIALFLFLCMHSLLEIITNGHFHHRFWNCSVFASLPIAISSRNHHFHHQF